MAQQTINGQYIPHGVNESNINVVTCKLTAILPAADTLDLALPSGVDKDLLPVFLRAYSNATPAVDLNVGGANIAITNHNRSTGITRLTATGAGLAAGTILVLGYSYAAV